MNWRRLLVFLGVVLVAVLLALPLRKVSDQVILLPLAYVYWLLHLLYISVDQQIWWIGVGILLFFFLIFSVIPEINFRPRPVKHLPVSHGKVENLAQSMQRSDSGIYFKWLVANRLGKLAHQILSQREHGKPRSAFSPLTGEGWNASPEVQQYLESGLQGSFADYPNTNWRYFSRREKTPLDHDVQEVIQFLESQQESENHF